MNDLSEYSMRFATALAQMINGSLEAESIMRSSLNQEYGPSFDNALLSEFRSGSISLYVTHIPFESNGDVIEVKMRKVFDAISMLELVKAIAWKRLGVD
ncbi:hypothetical protein Tco_0598908 [Tanacetum coccineum]